MEIFWNSRSFILRTRKSRVGKFKITYIFWIFPLHFLLDFLIRKIKEREFQNNFCCSLLYFYTYPYFNMYNIFILCTLLWAREIDIDFNLQTPTVCKTHWHIHHTNSLLGTWIIMNKSELFNCKCMSRFDTSGTSKNDNSPKVLVGHGL